MDSILTGMAIWSGLFMVGTTALGFYLPGAGEKVYFFHLMAGIGTAAFVVLTHGLVFTHLEGSGRAIKNDVKDYDLPHEFISRTKTFKRRASPPALYGMLLIGATAILGGWLRGSGGGGSAHLILVIITILLHVWIFPVEIKVVAENAVLMDEIAELKEKAEAAAELAAGELESLDSE